MKYSNKDILYTIKYKDEVEVGIKAGYNNYNLSHYEYRLPLINGSLIDVPNELLGIDFSYINELEETEEVEEIEETDIFDFDISEEELVIELD